MLCFYLIPLGSEQTHVNSQSTHLVLVQKKDVEIKVDRDYDGMEFSCLRIKTTSSQVSAPYIIFIFRGPTPRLDSVSVDKRNT